ncbi:hypothetical protein BDV95DRAFT_588720 [Massariosphaeria phaeospora]|uniref:Uncharacterized protein n=1 Tax=Massariosphaeria phaeospora TaxID=100035 RepID=A0A7C8M1E8_9PLEO|nr:hypothetical protein BDV95DRAFT_588720 [Massariosphaeria phaeospora]
MALVLVISFTLCFLCGVLLSAVLFYIDVKQLQTNNYDYFFETTTTLVFNVG